MKAMLSYKMTKAHCMSNYRVQSKHQADITESTYGVHTAINTVWAFDVQRPGLASYSDVGVAIDDDVNSTLAP